MENAHLELMLPQGHIEIMGDIVDLAKRRRSHGQGLPPRSRCAETRASSWQNIRKTGTGLAEEFRVFAYAGGLSDNPNDLSRDMRSLRAAFDLLKERHGREGVAGYGGFHAVLGSHGRSEWVDDQLFGSVLNLTRNFTIAEAALLIDQRLPRSGR